MGVFEDIYNAIVDIYNIIKEVFDNFEGIVKLIPALFKLIVKLFNMAMEALIWGFNDILPILIELIGKVIDIVIYVVELFFKYDNVLYITFLLAPLYIGLYSTSSLINSIFIRNETIKIETQEKNVNNIINE